VKAYLRFSVPPWINSALAHLVREQVPNDLHVTLAYLGEVEPENIPTIGKSIDYLLLRQKPSAPRIRIREFDVFTSEAGKLLVALAGIDPLEAWKNLRFELFAELGSSAPSIDHRAWTPHVTLAQTGDAPIPALQEHASDVLSWHPTEIELVWKVNTAGYGSFGRIDLVLPVYRF